MMSDYFDKIQAFKSISTNRNIAPRDLILIHAYLHILIKMKNSLGLEAMLEYISNSISAIARSNEDLEFITREVMKVVDVAKIYREVKQND